MDERREKSHQRYRQKLRDYNSRINVYFETSNENIRFVVNGKHHIPVTDNIRSVMSAIIVWA